MLCQEAEEKLIYLPPDLMQPEIEIHYSIQEQLAPCVITRMLRKVAMGRRELGLVRFP